MAWLSVIPRPEAGTHEQHPDARDAYGISFDFELADEGNEKLSGRALL